MTITLKVSENTKEKMIEYFEDKKRDKTPDYAVFQANEADTVITLYSSGKAVFQGKSADIDANMWKEMEQHLNPSKAVDIKNSEDKKKEDKKEIVIDPKIYNASCIGSDEVGTGDYFGPIVVCSAYVDKSKIKFLESLGIKDSKKMTDEKILEVVPKFFKEIPYECIILTNKQYNDSYNESMNMNKIKAVLHNKVLMKLRSVYTPEYTVVDQFAKPFVYYNYLKDVNHLKGITFLTKAEDKCLAVACASLISRYVFLKEFDKLGESIDMFLLKGASDKVDDVGIKIVERYGFDKLKDVAKINFKNTEKIKSRMS